MIMKKHIAMYLVMMCLTSVVGCRNGKSAEASGNADTLAMLDDAVRAVSAPMALADWGTLDSVRLSRPDSLLSLAVTIGDDYLDSAALVSDVASRYFIMGMMLDNEAVARMLDLARHVPVSIGVSLKGTDEASRISFRVPAADLRTARIENPSVRERDQLKVRNRVAYDNRFLPYDLEEGVRMVSMTVQDRYVTFRTEIDIEKLDFMMMKENRDSVSHAVVESLRLQLADSLTRKSLIEISEATLGYRNRYISSDSFDISFTPADLQRLVRVTDSINGISTRNRTNLKK